MADSNGRDGRTVWWIAPLGLAIGIILGALGGGGAILTVPILVYLLGQSPQAATAGSLIIVGLSAIVGMFPHHRAGRLRLEEGIIFGVLGVVGSVVGAALSSSVAPHVLMSAFAVLMLAVAVLMTRKRRQNQAQQRRADATPSSPSGDDTGDTGGTSDTERIPPIRLRPWRIDAAGATRVALAATGVGLLTGFFGVGGGFAVVPALVLVLGFSMPTAVGTSLLVIAINSATAFIARLGSGIDLDWPLILTFSVFGAIGSLLGGKVAQKADPDKLNLAFTILLVVVATYVGIQNFPQLWG